MPISRKDYFNPPPAVPKPAVLPAPGPTQLETAQALLVSTVEGVLRQEPDSFYTLDEITEIVVKRGNATWPNALVETAAVLLTKHYGITNALKKLVEDGVVERQGDGYDFGRRTPIVWGIRPQGNPPSAEPSR